MKRRRGAGFGALPLNTLTKGIRTATKADRKRETHGYTKNTSFFVHPDGQIWPWSRPRFGWPSKWALKEIQASPDPAPDVTMVHSHSAENWKQWAQLTEQQEPFTTFSLGDVKVLRNLVRARMGNSLALIMADGRMETLTVPDNAVQEFQSIGDELLQTRVEGTKWQRATLFLENIPWWEVDRHIMRRFAERHGLEYTEGLWWKPRSVETPLVKHRKPLHAPKGVEYQPEFVYMEDPSEESATHRYYDSPYYEQIPPELWPVVPVQPELEIERKGQRYTWQKGRLEPYVQTRFLGDPLFSGRLMNCGAWTQSDWGRWYCVAYAPACDAQTACQPVPPGSKQMKVCANTKRVWSDYYNKKITRCKRYAAACAPGACLPETMPVPREEEPELPSERDVRDAAQWMAEEHNMLQQEAGPWLAREIASRGGIAPYRRGYLKEEYKEIPLHLKNKRGLKLDEMASEMRMDEAELVTAIYAAYPKGTRIKRRKTWEDFERAAYSLIMQERAA